VQVAQCKSLSRLPTILSHLLDGASATLSHLPTVFSASRSAAFRLCLVAFVHGASATLSRLSTMFRRLCARGFGYAQPPSDCVLTPLCTGLRLRSAAFRLCSVQVAQCKSLSHLPTSTKLNHLSTMLTIYNRLYSLNCFKRGFYWFFILKKVKDLIGVVVLFI